MTTTARTKTKLKGKCISMAKRGKNPNSTTGDLGSTVSKFGGKMFKWGALATVTWQVISLAIFCMTAAIYGYPKDPLKDRQPGAMQGLPPDSNYLSGIRPRRLPVLNLWLHGEMCRGKCQRPLFAFSPTLAKQVITMRASLMSSGYSIVRPPWAMVPAGRPTWRW